MKLVPSGVSRSIAKSVLKTKMNSPHLFFVGGVAGVVGAGVLACKATLKLEQTLDEIKKDFADVTDMGSYDEIGRAKYTESQYRKDVGYVYMKGAVKIGKLYAPSVIIGSVSIAALTGSHVQMTRRNKALAATLSAVMAAYDAYRARVREEIGEERELELYRDIHDDTVEVDGKKKQIKKIASSKYSVYARVFDEYNPNWRQSSETNRVFLQCQQDYANHQLQARGHVFLNDVYDSLGFERTSAGAVVGWVRDSDKDGYIDFGIFEAMNSRFVNNLEPSIWLDFNVDGVVYDLIEEPKHRDQRPY